MNRRARVFDAAHLNLAGTFTRASAIQPPAGMEAFHQEFLAWAQAMTDMGNGWAAAMSSGDTSAYGGVFENAINVHTSFTLTLETEMSATSTTPAPELPVQPTPGTQTTQPTEAAGTDPDARAAYLEAVQAEFLTVNQALTDFGTVMEALGNETTTIEEARPIANGAMETLAGTNGRVSGIQPPAGMETFHQEFLDWAGAMTTVGTVWADFVAGAATAEDHSAAFSQAIEVHNTFADTMIAALEAPAQQTTDTPTQTTQTTTTATDADARATYLAAVQGEYDAATAELSTVLGTLEAMTNETLAAADAVPILDASHQVLAGTSDRAAAIQPPAGMEAFHQEFLAWAQSMTELGLGWAEGIASGNLDAYNALFGTALEAHTAFAISLETELTASGGLTTGQTNTTETTTRTTRTTTAETPVATEVTGTTSSSDDDERAAYLQAVRAEYDAVDAQIEIIFATLDEVASETMAGEEAIGILDGTTLELYKSADRIDLMQPPAGMEAFHESFVAWQEAVIATGDAWIQFIDQGAEFGVYSDALSALLAAHVDFGATLELEETGVTGNTSAQADETPVATETTATTRTTRTTRTTETETATVAADTPTTRTTRTTRTTSATTTGNSSETSGNAGLTAAGGGEWLMPENGVTITWTEPFSPDESDGDAMESDAAASEDVMRLVWEPAIGVSEDLTVTVLPPDSGDASAVVSALQADDQTAAEIFGEGAELVESVVSPEASAALIQLNIPQADLWVFIQYTCLDANCSAMSVVLIVSGPENLPSLLTDLEQGVAIDGIAITNAIPVSDIENSLSNPGN